MDEIAFRQSVMKKVQFILGFLIGDVCFATNRTRLFQDIIDNHDARVAPFDTALDSLPLTLIFFLMSLRQVNEKDQAISLSLWTYMGWQDSRLSWTPSSYGGIKRLITTSKQVWTPSTVCLFNEINEDKCFTDERLVSITSFGWATYATTRETVTQCAIDISMYPFDLHNCTLYYGNLFHDNDFLEFNLDFSLISTEYFIQNEEWDLINTDIRETFYVSLNVTIRQVHVDVIFKRRPIYVLLSVFLPVVMLSVLNLFCFILPIESGEKMGTSMAIFLTFAVFLTIINDSMPKSDKTPYFTVFLVTQLLISGLTVILESIVLYVHFKEKEKPTEPTAKIFPLDLTETIGATSKRNSEMCKRFKISGNTLDKISMISIIIIDLISVISFLALTS